MQAAPAGVDQPAVAGAEVPPARDHRLFWWKEALIAVVFYAVYSWTRNQFGSNRLGEGIPEHAFNNARRVIRLERLVGLFHEESIQEWFLAQRWLIQAMNTFYGTAHFVVTLGVFLLLFLKRKDVFAQWRNTLAVMTALAIVGFALFPLMPPRLLDAPCSEFGGACIGSGLRQEGGTFGFVDTLAVYGGPWSFDSEGMADISNQFAAMPSLHIGWATWSAIALWPLIHRWWLRAAVLAYPLMTLLVIIVTGNHFWLDAIGGLLIFAVGAIVGWGIHRWNQERLDREWLREHAAAVSAPPVGAIVLAALLAAPPSTPPPFDQATTTIDALVALERPVVLAHTGGEDQYPGSTMYAFGQSVAAGVDVLDLNVTLSADDILVVQHDLTVDRTTNGTGNVSDLSFAELHALDNAYWFTPECGTCTDQPPEAYVYRGIRTGEASPPEGFATDDFAIPKLADIISAFPDIPLNVEVKGTGELAIRTAEVLVAELTEHDRLDSTVLTSFDDAVVTHVTTIAPDVEVSPGLAATAAFIVDNTPLPEGQRILQLPPTFEQTELLTPEIISAAHSAGYVIWVWPNDRALENAEAYADFLARGVDGLNINFPEVGVAAVETFTAAATSTSASTAG